MVVRVQLTEKQLQGILATGCAACSRSTTVEASADDIVTRVEPLLAKASAGTVARTADGALVVDRSGPFMVEEWLARLTTFGPKSTVDLRAARALRPWIILTTWFLVTPAFGVAAAAMLFVAVDRPPGFAPGLVFVAGVTAAVLGIMKIANVAAKRWTSDAYRRLGDIEQSLASASSAASYRT
ncbi:MAG TPA: hypothetical protein VLT33_02820 [Labilithrix sp.]|nr:hypothetical protein [Labilithrix sp.]